jgi:hypothetical protein
MSSDKLMQVTSKIDLFRTLSSFAPKRVDLSRAPWEAYVDWAIANGLAPLSAYNLEYRLGASGSPEWARDRMLSIYQGTANDNVMKLVNLKQHVDDLVGRKLILLGSATFAESVYPHVAFRPVIDLRIALPATDVDPFANYLRRAEFQIDDKAIDPSGASKVLNDTRTMLYLHGPLTGNAAFDSEVAKRLLPLKVYGPSMFRLDLEDALAVQILFMSRAGFVVPMIEWVDLRELLTGAPSMGGVYSRPVDATRFKENLALLKLDRASFAALSIVKKLFPETAPDVDQLMPSVNVAVRELIELGIVNPVADIGRTEHFVFEERLRNVLLGT